MGKAISSPLFQGKIWKNKQGNLVAMTSNTSPSPYVATAEGWITGGNAFNVFDNNINTTLNANYTGGVFGASLKLAYPIRIKKIYQAHGASGQGVWSWFVQAIFKDGTSANIVIGSNLSGETNISEEFLTKEVIEVGLYTYARSDIIAYIQEFKIIEWEE